jgi:steroid delta-isomerase-like uncharacterized protein
MAEHDNKSLALRFLQAWTAGGESVVDELAAPDLIVNYSHFPEPIAGPADFKEMLGQIFESFPDMRIHADEVLVDGDRVMIRWTYTATHQHGEVFGVRPTGKPVRVSGITVYRIVDGRVKSEEGVADSLSMMLQLGAVPVAP